MRVTKHGEKNRSLMLASTAAKMYLCFTRIHAEFIAICYLSRMVIKNSGLECGWCRLCDGQLLRLVAHHMERSIDVADEENLSVWPSFRTLS